MERVKAAPNTRFAALWTLSKKPLSHKRLQRKTL
ncbi:hypothetical protein J2728_002946 [Caulobacter segnis]|nr:hypothetical protein [Caulobacter segnis]